MRRGYFLLALLCCAACAHTVRAQNVGIGTTNPDASALLDLTSTTMGLLTPRVTTAQMNSISSPSNGLLVYNTTANSFYFNIGTPAVPNWIPFASTSTVWSLTGNSSTTPGTNFLGTTDAQALVFKTNATERMRMLATGNIGIGTTTPAGYLDIGPTITATAGTTTYASRVDPTLSGALATAMTAHYNSYGVPTVNLTGGASNTLTTLYNSYVGLTGTAGTIGTYYGSYIAAPSGSATITNKYAFATESAAGNVGIGTTTPTQALDVSGNVRFSGALMPNNSAGTSTFLLQSTGAGSPPTWIDPNATFWKLSGNSSTTPGTHYLGTSDAQALVIKTNGTERMRVLSTGAVGVGTATPTEALDVTGNLRFSGALMPNNTAGTSGYLLQSAGASTAPTWIDPNTTFWRTGGNGGTTPGTHYLGTSDAQALVLKTNATERLRVLSTGNIGIGTTSPTSLVHAIASGAQTSSYTGFLLSNTSTSSTASINKYGLEVLSTGSWTGTSDTNVGLHVQATGGTTNVAATFEGGNVGVKTVSPATAMDVNGDIATRYSAITLSNGTNNNVAAGSSSFVRISGPTTSFTVTGIAGGVDGKRLVLYNSTSNQMTISDNSSSSSRVNRIYTLSNEGSGDVTLRGKGAVELIYSALDSAWLATSLPTSSTGNSPTTIHRKTSSTTRSSTSLTTDSDFDLELGANEVWVYEGYLDVYGTGDFDMRWSGSTVSSLLIGVHASNNGGPTDKMFTVTVNAINTTLTTSGGSVNTSTFHNPVAFYGVIVNGSTPGTVHLEWAPKTANPTTVAANSFIRGVLTQ